jgi:hypothetical protein
MDVFNAVPSSASCLQASDNVVIVECGAVRAEEGTKLGRDHRRQESKVSSSDRSDRRQALTVRHLKAGRILDQLVPRVASGCSPGHI